jgi:hypothetical protein
VAVSIVEILASFTVNNESMDDELIKAIDRNTAAIQRQMLQAANWKLAFRNGLLAGLGGVLGATLIVTLLIWVVQPFKEIGPLKPTLDRLTEALERNNRSR